MGHGAWYRKELTHGSYRFYDLLPASIELQQDHRTLSPINPEFVHLQTVACHEGRYKSIQRPGSPGVLRHAELRSRLSKFHLQQLIANSTISPCKNGRLSALAHHLVALLSLKVFATEFQLRYPFSNIIWTSVTKDIKMVHTETSPDVQAKWTFVFSIVLALTALSALVYCFTVRFKQIQSWKRLPLVRWR